MVCSVEAMMVQVKFHRVSALWALAISLTLLGAEASAQDEIGTPDDVVPEIETTTIEASVVETPEVETPEVETPEVETPDGEIPPDALEPDQEVQSVGVMSSESTDGSLGAPEDTVTSATEPGALSESFLSRSQVRSALVEYRTAWERGVGFLVGDRRTVVTLGRLRDRYRPITVKMHGSTDSEVRVASVEIMEQEESTFVVLHLAGDVTGEPLELSPDRPGVGESVYLILKRGMRRRDQVVPDAFEAAEASITAASTTSVTVGLTWSQVWQGSPLFDGAGRVVAFFGSEGYAIRVSEILTEQRLRSGRSLIAPIAGIRVGTEFGGELIDPFLIEFDLGLALWDQFGIVFRLGVGIGDEVLAPYIQNEDVASTALADERTVNMGLELKYRILITRSSMPLYFDVVAGLNYTMSILEFHDIAIYQDVHCDSRYQDCDRTPGFASGRRTDHGVGPSFGFDIRAGLFTMGYRFIGEAISYELETTHRLTFGVTFR